MNRQDMNQRDRRMKWLMLGVSLLTLGFLIAAALIENVFPRWRHIRLDYARILEAKATDERARAIADQFEITIQQNVLPELDAVDRCITCHPGVDDPRMVDQPQPFRTHSGDYLLDHPPDKFGCTICHRGQGRALVFEEAKAVGHHWDYPLLPTELTQSACGLCHTADAVAERGGGKYALGRELFHAKGCLACHKLSGRGGNMGPELDSEGLKVKGQLPMAQIGGPHTLPQWQIEHFINPQKIVHNSQMKPPQLSGEEIEALTIYMLSLQERDLPRSYLSPTKHLEYYKAANPDPRSGEALYRQFCSLCHDTGRFSRYDKFYGQFFPAVRGSTFIRIASPQFIDENIRRGRPGTLMPAWGADAGGLSEEEIVLIREYLLETTAEPSATSPRAVLETSQALDYRAAGNAESGGAIFTRHCVGCHGPGASGKLAPSLVNPVFQETATDGFLFATIAHGRRDTAMPAFFSDQGGFTASQIEDVVTFLRSLGGRMNGSTKQTAAESASP